MSICSGAVGGREFLPFLASGGWGPAPHFEPMTLTSASSPTGLRLLALLSYEPLTTLSPSGPCPRPSHLKTLNRIPSAKCLSFYPKRRGRGRDISWGHCSVHRV